MKRRIVTLGLALGLALAPMAPAMATHDGGSQVYYHTRSKTDAGFAHAHWNISHWDRQRWMSATGGTYGPSIRIALAVYACPTDGACTDAWRSWVQSAASSWNSAVYSISGGRYPITFNTTVVGPLPGYPNPCGDWAQTVALGRSYVVPVCYNPNPTFFGEFAHSFDFSSGAWHVLGGKLSIGPASTTSTMGLMNALRHEMGHALGLGHRGGYGYDDPRSGFYHAHDGAVPGSVMGYYEPNAFLYPDFVDAWSAIYLNGGGVTAGGTVYCYNDHTGWCPGVNAVG